MSKEAMKLALEALEAHADIGIKSDKAITALREALAKDVPETNFGNTALDKMAENARELGLDYEPAQQEPIKQGWDVDTLLDKPIPLKDFYKPAQQEPVAWEYCEEIYAKGNPELNDYIRANGIPLYTTPQAQPAQQEPVAWGIIASNTGRICQVELDADEVEGHNPKHIVPLYTTPQAQRTWVGLTPEQAVDLYKATETDNRMVLIDAIEAKLKERNT